MTIEAIKENAVEIAMLEAAISDARARVNILKPTLIPGLAEHGEADGEGGFTLVVTDTVLAGESVTVEIKHGASYREKINVPALVALTSEAEVVSVASVDKSTLKNSRIPEATWRGAVELKASAMSVSVKPFVPPAAI